MPGVGVEREVSEPNGGGEATLHTRAVCVREKRARADAHAVGGTRTHTSLPSATTWVAPSQGHARAEGGAGGGGERAAGAGRVHSAIRKRRCRAFFLSLFGPVGSDAWGAMGGGSGRHGTDL